MIWLAIKGMLERYLTSLADAGAQQSYAGFINHSSIDVQIMKDVLNKDDVGRYVRALLPETPQ
jgi:hypothetical protein